MVPKDRVPLWLWPNLLSLDAPLIALLWQDFLHRCYPSLLRVPGRLTLGLTVWAIYVADRILDAGHPPAGPENARHTFYRNHPVFSRVLLAAIVAIDALVSLTILRPAVFWNGLLIGLAVSAYLWIFSFRKPGGRLGKQLAASLLFTSGVFLVAWTGSATTVWPPLAFSALCLGNLILIENWERNQPSPWPSLWLAALALACLATGNLPFFQAIAASAAALAVLAIGASRSRNAELPGVLADAALLSPFFFR